MKIGILTYQYAINYGAVLQAYALKKFLESRSNEVEIINYNTNYLYLSNRTFYQKLKTSVWGILRNILGGNKKIEALDIFRQRYLELNPCQITTKEKLQEYVSSNNFDSFIVGSDQVWNNSINGNDDSYFLSFASSETKISYAASFGVSDLTGYDIELLKNNLKSFKAISVRENTAKKMLNNIGIQNVSVVLDPVFLLEKEKWDELAGYGSNEGPYILCYVMPGDTSLEKKIRETAIEYSRKTGWKIIYIGRKEYKRFIPDGYDYIGASPIEFIRLIRDARIILTNSFHGTAFSLIFQKQFFSFANTSLTGEMQLSSRICDLLWEIGLADHIIGQKDNSYNIDNHIDYNKVNSNIDSLRNKSLSFLISSIAK